MPILSNLIVRIGASTDDFDKQVDRSLNKIKRFGADVSAAGMALSVGFSAPLIAAGAAALKAGADMESLTMGLKAVMKDSKSTADEMAKLREVAKLPGLGLEEAVKGTIRLQILGNSADQSRRIMSELGNALAVVGGGKADFSEVIRQLSQLGATGKVTKENLDPIVERIPQIAAIIKEKFGAEALGDPAKTFEKMGISAQQFISIITDELAKGERAGNTYKNSWENLEMAAKEAAGTFGKSLLPIAQRVLDEFLTPGIEKAKALADAFGTLSPEAQGVALGLTAISASIPLLVVGLGTVATNAAAILAVGSKIITWAIGVTASISAISVQFHAYVAAAEGVAAGSVAATTAVGLWVATAAVAASSVLYLAGAIGKLWDAQAKVKESSDNMTFAGARLAESIQRQGGVAAEQLRVYDGLLATGVMSQEAYNLKLRELASGLKTLPPLVTAAADAHGKLEEQVVKVAKAHESAKLPTSDLLALFERFRKAAGEKTESINKLAEMMDRYGTVTAAATERAARGLDLLFQSYRQLSDAPDLGNLNQIDFKKIPKAASPDLPGPGGFEDFVKGGKNIGPEGMMTKEQHAAITARYKDLGKVGKAAMQQVSTVITDLSRGITDLIFKGGKVGDMFKNIALQAAQSITRLLIEGALKNLQDKLFDIGGLMGKVFGSGGGIVKSAVPGVTAVGLENGGLGALGSASKGIGGAASATASSLTAVVGAVGSVVSAISGVIGNFQMAGMNKSLDLIEKEVRYSQIHLLNTLNKANEYWPYMKSVWESLIRMEERQMAVAGGGVTINVNGGDTKAVLDELTRLLKQYGVIPR